LALQRLERTKHHARTWMWQRRHDSAGGVFEGGTLGALQRSGQLENQRIQLGIVRRRRCPVDDLTRCWRSSITCLPVSGMNALAIRPWMAGVFCYFKRDMTKASC